MSDLKPGMRLIVCGGRDYSDDRRVWAAMRDLAPEMVIEGGAAGADWLAGKWADSTRTPHLRFPARWDSEGMSAGPKRNQRMLDLGIAEGVLAFPGGKGTADMVRRALQAGLPVQEVSE